MNEPWLARLLAVFAVAIAAIAVFAATRADDQEEFARAPLTLGPVECDRFAAVGGDDDGPGSLGSPYATAQHLVDELREGETGCLRAGTHGGVEIDPEARPGYRETKITSPEITLSSFPGERARLDNRLWVAASDVTVANVDLAGTNPLRYAPSSLTIAGDRGGPPIERVRLIGNDITNDHQRICVNLGVPGYGRPLATVIEANRIHDCGVFEYPPTATDPPPGREFTGHWNEDHGIYVGLATDTLIRRNLIYDNASRGVQLYPDSENTRVAANVIDNNGVGVLIGGIGDLLSAGNVVAGNMITASSERFNVEHSFPGCVAEATDGCPPDNVVRSNCLVADNAAIDYMPAIDQTQDDYRAFYATDGGLLDAGRGGPYEASIQEADDGANLVLEEGTDPYRDRAAKDFRLADESPCGSVVGGDHAAGLGRWSAAERAADAGVGAPAAAVGSGGVEAVASIPGAGAEVAVAVRRPTRPSMAFPQAAAWELSAVPGSGKAAEVSVAAAGDRVMAAWTEPAGVISSTLDAGGEWGEPVVVSGANGSDPAIAFGPPDTWAAAWVEDGKVMAAIDGGESVLVAAGREPAMAASDSGSYLVAWVNRGSIRTVTISADGDVGTSEAVRKPTPGDIEDLDLAIAADGSIALTGLSRLDETHPRAIAVSDRRGRQRTAALSDAGVPAGAPGIAIAPGGAALVTWSGLGSCDGCAPLALQAARYLP